MAEAMTAKLRLQHHAMVCARNGLFILDASRQDCPIIFANPAFEKITGYSATEPLGDETLCLLRDEASRNSLPGMRAILQGGAADHPVVREYRRDGAGFGRSSGCCRYWTSAGNRRITWAWWRM
jgi:PAS domain-containing protein